jgi:DNA-directed RNA polymerase beta' subunit
LPFPNASIDQDARAKVSTWRPSVNYESADVASMPWTNLYEQVLTDKLVCVRDGQLHCGRLNQSVIGCARAGVVQNMVHDFGEATTLRYLSDSQRMFCSWIANHGFGLGLSDAQTKKETHDEIGLLKTRVLEYLTKEYKHSSPAVAEKFTGMVLDRLLNATSVMVTKPQLGVVNYMLDVISSGAKGKKANIGQTSAMVGQIVVGEQRLPMGYNGVRCSPHWPANSPDPRSRGACISSFLDGLNMYEYFAHAMGTREGLVDTASKTAEVGYAIRKFMRAMEDLMVEQDGSVRDPNSGIVCFRYGGDGFDVSRLESQQYPLMQVTKRADLDRTFADPSLVRLASVGGFDKLLKEEVDALERDILLWRRVKARQHSNFRTTAVTGEVKVAVHLDRILKNAERAVGVHGGRVVHPLQVMRDRNELLMRCRRHARVPIDAVDDTNHGYFSFESMVRAYLATASIVQRLRLSKAGWDSVVQEAEIRFVRSLVHPGDMVGCLAGHSIGEPAQQMTLNTFHLAGTGASNMTAGLPRIKELIRVASNCLNPHMAVHLLDSSPDAVNQALRQFSPLHLRDILKTHESGLFYDPDAFAVQVLPAEEKKGGKSKRRSGKGTGAAAKSVRAAKAPKVKERVDLESKSCIQQDRALVESLLPFLQAKHVRDRSRFVIRLAIDKDKLMAESNGKLTIDHIYWKFCAVFKDSHLVFKSSPNAREWVIRIHAKIKSSDFRKLERQALSKRDGMAASTSAAVPATSSLQSTSLPNLDPSTAASDKSQPIAAEATSASSSGLGLDRQLAEIRTVQQMANMIGDIRLRGVDNIKSAYVSGSKNANGQTIIETVGSNLQQVLTMSNVDKTQTTTNMLDQIARAFGVKAAAAATVKEYQSLYQANASDVERHHLYTLAAQMSKTGELVGLNRNQVRLSALGLM